MESLKEQPLFEIEIFCNILVLFLSVFMHSRCKKKSINFFQKILDDPKLFNISLLGHSCQINNIFGNIMTQLFHFVLIFFFQRKSNINSDESQNVKFHG